MKKILLIMFIVAVGYKTTAQVISIPDQTFEQILINQEIDTDATVNGQISIADALAVTNLIITYEDNINSEFINDLTGIEAFTNLESLTINFTMIEELNVTTLVNLKYLDCQDNICCQL